MKSTFPKTQEIENKKAEDITLPHDDIPNFIKQRLP